MDKIIDFSECQDGMSTYGGSDHKISIVYNDEKYMLKFPEVKTKYNNLQTSHVNNVFSEYIGSHIMQSLGLQAHDTLIGLYKDEPVVACKDFNGNGYRLQEFGDLLLNLYRPDEIGRIPTYDQIQTVIETHPRLHNCVEEAKEAYWETIVGDALIGNFDRHKNNFGYLVNEETRDVRPAPIYDCGSSLYPNLSEEGMKQIMDSHEAIAKRIYVFPAIALNMNNDIKHPEKARYYDFLSSNYDETCTKALYKIQPKISMEKIHSIVNNTPMISETRKEFYNYILDIRKSAIIDHALSNLLMQDIGPIDQFKEYIIDDRYFDIGRQQIDKETSDIQHEIQHTEEHTTQKVYNYNKTDYGYNNR